MTLCGPPASQCATQKPFAGHFCTRDSLSRWTAASPRPASLEPSTFHGLCSERTIDVTTYFENVSRHCNLRLSRQSSSFFATKLDKTALPPQLGWNPTPEA